MSSTYQQHARIYRKIANLNNGGDPIVCMFSDCEKHAYRNFVYVEHRHPAPLTERNCEAHDMRSMAMTGAPSHIRHGFCSERHRMMFVESGGWRVHRLLADRGHAFGYLPTGSRGMTS
jgi:hypothetical protein